MTPVELPVPPSANALWRVVRTRKGTASVTLQRRYRDWLDEAILRLRVGMSRVRAYPVAVRIEVRRGKGWNASRDIDNTIKSVVDALRKAGRIENDSGEFVTGVSAKFGPDAANACVLVSVEPAEVPT